MAHRSPGSWRACPRSHPMFSVLLAAAVRCEQWRQYSFDFLSWYIPLLKPSISLFLSPLFLHAFLLSLFPTSPPLRCSTTAVKARLCLHLLVSIWKTGSISESNVIFWMTWRLTGLACCLAFSGADSERGQSAIREGLNGRCDRQHRVEREIFLSQSSHFYELNICYTGYSSNNKFYCRIDREIVNSLWIWIHSSKIGVPRPYKSLCSCSE